MASGALGEWGERIDARVGEFSASIHFLTRLPLPRHAGAAGANLAQAAWAFPLAGFVVGLIGAIAYALAHKFVVFAWPAAALTVAATLLVTGALHEDGLADTADGFGGGDTREKKLAIMRDSRIGTYGVCALIISLLIRADAIASLTEIALVAPALIAAHVGARAVLPFVMFLLPAARSDGLAFAAGKPSGVGVAIAAALAIPGAAVLSRACACAGRLGGAGDRGVAAVLARDAADRRPDRRRARRGRAGERDRHFAGGAAVAHIPPREAGRGGPPGGRWEGRRPRGQPRRRVPTQCFAWSPSPHCVRGRIVTIAAAPAGACRQRRRARSGRAGRRAAD